MWIELTPPAGSTFSAGIRKHAPNAAPESAAPDLRSVGELLVDADHLARTLLLDVDAVAAPGLLHSWVDTVSAAAALWDTIPGREYAADESRRLIERVTALAASVESDLDTARWPGPGDGDHRMDAITGNLARARELVDRYGSEVPTHSPLVQKDLEAARTRVVHTLYIATHGVSVALNEDGRERAADPVRADVRRAAAARGRYEVGPGVRWADRLGVAERALGCYLRPGRFADAMVHEQTAPVVGLPRLREALARFDIQAHHTLVDAPDAGNLVLATRTEGMFFGAALVLARAAAETGRCDQAIRAVDLDSLSAAGEAWMGLARRWRDLMPQGARLDPALGKAAAQLRSACRELTHDGAHLAAAVTIAQRVDLAEVLPVIAHYVDAATELAEATQPALRDPHLVAPSRAVVRRLTQDVVDGHVPDSVCTDLVAIVARDNRLGPVPDPLLKAMSAAATGAERTSRAVANAMLASLGTGEHPDMISASALTTRLGVSTARATAAVGAPSPDVAPGRPSAGR